MIPGGLAAGTRDVHAAYDGSLIAQVETGGAAAVETALATAFAKYRDRDSWLTSAQRIAILERTAGIIQSRAEELAVGAAREGGKPLIDSRVEIARGIDGVRNSIEVMRTEGGKEIPMGINAASLGRVAFTRKEPIGVVVAVSAFNHPFNLIIHQVMPAVATGCPIIVKPAAATPLSCMRIVGILREAGLPEAWCQPIVTASSDDATRLATDPRVSFFAFIGSPGVGWMLRSKLAPGTRCALEHGGAAPVIVAEDATWTRRYLCFSRADFIMLAKFAFPCNGSLRTPRSRESWRTVWPTVPGNCGSAIPRRRRLKSVHSFRRRRSTVWQNG